MLNIINIKIAFKNSHNFIIFPLIFPEFLVFPFLFPESFPQL